MKYGDLNLGQIEALINKLGGMTAVKGILRGVDVGEAIAKLLAPDITVYRVTVNRDKNLKAMIEAGQYDWTDPDVTDERILQVEGSGMVEVDIKLFHYNRPMDEDDVYNDLRHGYRPAKIEELLALGANLKTRDLQRQFPIVAFGSVCLCLDGYGHHHHPCLSGDESDRRFYKASFNTTWPDIWRFAAVSKPV
ncbi:MAG: hypothetical protein AAB402_03080 [Patescibacteria group bacterium]